MKALQVPMLLFTGLAIAVYRNLKLKYALLWLNSTFIKMTSRVFFFLYSMLDARISLVLCV